jgi:osmoprotectant transport system permease protein
MQIFNIGNTIPSLAVLAIALGIFGIGDRPAITALFLASLLPITRNTYEGMKGVSPALREAARGIGMTPWQSLTRVELPNALPIMVGGIRTALAINVGSAPLAYLIGADSLGTLIFPGIYLNNQQQMLLGAAATAVLALVLDGIVAAGSRRALARRGLAA